MIEMDRFVTTLKGEETEEIIERQDYDSAATMKHYETNDRYPITIQSVCRLKIQFYIFHIATSCKCYYRLQKEITGGSSEDKGNGKKLDCGFPYNLLVPR